MTNTNHAYMGRSRHEPRRFVGTQQPMPQAIDVLKRFVFGDEDEHIAFRSGA